jgi:two-component system, OmpR family, sensor kinase
MSAVFHSLRWRLQLWHGAILLLAVLAFCLTAYRLAWDNQLRHIDKALGQNEWAMFHGLMVASRPDGTGNASVSPERMVERLRAGTVTLPADTAARFGGTEPGYLYFAIYERDGKQLLRSENLPSGIAVPGGNKEVGEHYRLIGSRRETMHDGPGGLVIVSGRDIAPELEGLHRFGWSLAAVGLAVWSLGLLGGWWLAGRAIKPIAAISRTATRIAAGNLAERIDTQGTDSELDQLSRVLNATFERLHASFEQQKQFTADASHELRTPITILLSETQRILKRERTPVEYAEAIHTCHDTAARMRRLVEALLLLARQDAAGASAPRETCDLATILRETIDQLAPLAKEFSVELHAELPATPCRADPASLAILATNLVANAIQHNRSGGHVHVTCSATPRAATFTVGDDGPGIPAEDLPHIFRRFYRVDKARAGSSGHTGLGLAIAKAIVDNHGGTIAVASADGRGARFTVTLPPAPRA